MSEPNGSPPDPSHPVDLAASPRAFRRPPARPVPDRALVERLQRWLHWFGVARLVATVIGVVMVGAGVFWLVRAPAPPAEAILPMATDRPAAAGSGGSSGTTATSATTPTAPPAESESGREVDAETIVIHVAGNVVAPGIYRLDEERRVHDAIEIAGGGTADADLDAVNLAQELFDGQRLYVPAIGATDPASIEVVTPPPAPGSAGGGPMAGPVDINRATTDERETLPGGGPSTARAIVDERERNGPFATVDELERVPGIGPTKLGRLRDLVVV